MANTLKFKRGLLAGLPTAAEGEPLFTTDTKDLYIGTSTGNQRFQKYIASGTTSQLLRGDGSLLTMPIVLTSPANGEVLKYNGTNWVNSSDAGITGSGSAGQVAFFTGATTQSGSNNLFWDATNNRLGIGTNAPVRTLDVRGFISSFDGTTRTEMVNGGGVGYIGTLTNHPLALQTNNIERIRLHAGGNLHVGGTTDNGLRFQVTGDGYFSGSVGIGSTGLTDINLRIAKSLGSSVFPVSVYVDGLISSAATSAAAYFQTVASTQNLTFTLPSLYHYRAVQGTFGASSTVTNQYGYIAESTLIGATNNFGFYGNIASGTGRWNLYMNGTANNYIAGSLGIGTASPASKLHTIGGDMLLGLDWASAIYDASTIRNFRIASNGGNSGYITQAAYNSAATANTTFFRNYVNAATTGAWVVEAGVGNFNTNSGLPSSYSEVFRIAQSGAATFSSNVGINVTPSAWGSTSRALQIGTTTGLENWSGSTVLENNGFRNSAGDYKYLTTSFATSYAQSSNGRHEWYLAPSGTAGATITFTQAMTLFNDGNLVINDVNNAGFKLDVNGTFRASQLNLSALNTAPATSSSTGTLGEIRIDANHIYICTATNTWKRVAISTF